MNNKPDGGSAYPTNPISNERLAKMLAEVQTAIAAAIGEWPYKASAGVTFDTMCSILTELQSRRQSPAGVRVKGLEWHGDNGHGAGFKYVIAEPSRTPGWRVWVNLTDIGANGMATPIGGCIVTMKAESRDAAKAAAQADYERRVLSSLSVKEPEVVVPVAWFIPPDADGVYQQVSTQHYGDPDLVPLYASPPPKAVTITEEVRGKIAYALTKRMVIDMPTARAAVDEALYSEAHNG